MTDEVHQASEQVQVVGVAEYAVLLLASVVSLAASRIHRPRRGEIVSRARVAHPGLPTPGPAPSRSDPCEGSAVLTSGGGRGRDGVTISGSSASLLSSSSSSASSGRRQGRPSAVFVVFHVLAALTFVARLALFCLCALSAGRAKKGVPVSAAQREGARALERACAALFFGTFSLVVFSWAEDSHKRYVSTDRFLPSLRLPFISANLVNLFANVALGILLSVVAAGGAGSQGARHDDGDHDHEVVRLASRVYESCVMGVLAVASLFYGARGVAHARRAGSGFFFERRGGGRRLLLSMLSAAAVPLILALCLATRAAGVLTLGPWPDALVAATVMGPEAVAFAAEAVRQHRERVRSTHSCEFITGLYDQEEAFIASDEAVN